mmetsp:Transcript_16353/g.26641  ORF Transcript_16353/g.26641 Transcript_16353/m.26641 type:complete len:238 (+) Transcript_16353:61-774(+)
MLLVITCLFCCLVLVLRAFASQVYDVVIVKMTSKWYHAVLGRVAKKARVLDVGIGTGSALLRNKEGILGKDLRFVGVDYDQGYVQTAEKQVQEAGLGDRIQVYCKSIFDADLGKTVGEDLFDAAYFSGSWTLMPNPVQALRIAASFVKPQGRIYVTQTFQKANTPVLGLIKPMLKYVTTIDFGPLHYERHLAEYLKEAERLVNGEKLVVEENIVVPGSIDNSYQSARLIVFKKVRQE